MGQVLDILNGTLPSQDAPQPGAPPPDQQAPQTNQVTAILDGQIKPGGPAAAEATAAQPQIPAEQESIGRRLNNVGLGANEAIASTLGFPMDIAERVTRPTVETGGFHRAPKSGQMVPNTQTGPARDLFGGTQSFLRGMNALGVNTNQQPQDNYDKLLRGTGQALGLLGSPAISAAARIPGQAIGAVGSVLSKEAMATRAYKNLFGSDVPNGAARIPGVQLSTAELSGDPGMLALAKTRQQLPQNATGELSRIQGNNQAITDALQGVAHPEGAGAASQTVADRLAAMRDAAKAERTAAYAKSGIDESTTKIPTGPLKQAINTHINNLGPFDRLALPAEAKSALRAIPNSMTLKDADALDLLLGSIKNKAAASGDYNGARLIGDVRDHVRQFRDNPNVIGTAGVDKEALDEARSVAAQYKQTYAEPKGVKNALKYGPQATPPTAVAGDLIRPINTRGAPEALQAFLKASRGDPEMLQAGRQFVGSKFQEAATSHMQDLAGNRVVSENRLNTFLDNYQHVLDSDLFTPEQRQIFADIRHDVNMAGRTANAGFKGGSDTFANLMRNDLRKAFLGKWGSKATGAATRAVGAGVGYATHGMSVAGNVPGVADKVINSLLQPAADAFDKMLMDPDFARAMLTKASAGNAKMMPPAYRSTLMALLANQTAAGPVAAPDQTGQ